jgi:hypothetical protein
MMKQQKPFVVGTYRTTPFDYKPPPPPPSFPKNPQYESVQSKLNTYINATATSLAQSKPKESSNDTTE